MTSLSDWAENQRNYIKLQNGQSITAKYLSFRFKEDRFKPEKQTVEYKLELPNGQTKTWDNGTARVADRFGSIKQGTWVKIQREGEGPKTVYHVLPVDEPTQETTLDDSVNPEDIPF